MNINNKGFNGSYIFITICEYNKNICHIQMMEHFFLSKDKNRISKLCMYAGFVVVNSFGYYLFNNMFVNISTNIIGLLFITILYKSNFLKKLLMVVLIYIVNIIVESGVLYAFSYDMNTDILGVSVYECITSMGILLIVVLLEKTISVKIKNFQIEGFLWVLLLGIPIVSISMVVILVRNEIEKSYLIVVEVSGLLVINLIIFYLYNALENFYIQKKEQELTKQQINMYENELEIMKKSYYNIRALRHDMKHHMMELKFLVKKGEYDEILTYIDSMGVFILNSDEYVDSGNKEIDSTLNYLLQKADKILDNTKINIVLPENLSVHTFSINVILGNLLENAIDAAQKSKEKYLSIDMRTKRGLLFITIENSYDGSIQLNKNEIVTSRKNKESHGIGLKNVKMIVEEQGGQMQVMWVNNRFVVKVMLYLSSLND